MLIEEVLRRKAAGETNREIGARFGLSKAQIKWLVSRQSRKQRRIANGYVPQPKGRLRKGFLNKEQKRSHGLIELRMQAELKCRVIECFRGKYPIESMCHLFEVSRSQQRCKQTYSCHRVRR